MLSSVIHFERGFVEIDYYHVKDDMPQPLQKDEIFLPLEHGHHAMLLSEQKIYCFDIVVGVVRQADKSIKYYGRRKNMALTCGPEALEKGILEQMQKRYSLGERLVIYDEDVNQTVT